MTAPNIDAGMMHDRADWLTWPTIGVFRSQPPEHRHHGLTWFGHRLWIVLFRSMWWLERGRNAPDVLDALMRDVHDLRKVRTTDLGATDLPEDTQRRLRAIADNALLDASEKEALAAEVLR